MYPETDYKYFSRRGLSVTSPAKQNVISAQHSVLPVFGHLLFFLRRQPEMLLPVHSAPLSLALHCLESRAGISSSHISYFSQLILFIKQYLLGACGVRSTILIWGHERRIKQRSYLQQTYSLARRIDKAMVIVYDGNIHLVRWVKRGFSLNFL